MEKTAVFLKRTEGPAVIESAGRMLTGLKCKHVQVKQVTMPKVNKMRGGFGGHFLWQAQHLFGELGQAIFDEIVRCARPTRTKCRER